MGLLPSTWTQLGSIPHLSDSFPESRMSHLPRGGRLTFVCMCFVSGPLTIATLQKMQFLKEMGFKKNKQIQHSDMHSNQSCVKFYNISTIFF